MDILNKITGKESSQDKVKGWKDVRERQVLWMKVTGWQYKLTVDNFECNRSIFQFDGLVTSRPQYDLGGTPVSGEIEVPLEVKYPSGEGPEDSRGYLVYMDEDGSEPLLGVTLRCNIDAYNEMYRMFTSTFANKGNVYMEIIVIKPNGEPEGFWQSGWRDKEIPISHFTVFTGANVT